MLGESFAQRIGLQIPVGAIGKHLLATPKSN
jgi:hypothetical protein